MSKRLSMILVLVVMLLSNTVATAAPTPANNTTSQQDSPSFAPVYIRSHRVDVEIRDQIAKTRIEQVFVNETDRMAEGTYVFPLPAGVTISDLEMIIDGVPIQAEILEKDEARRIYDEIVRTLRDPALLEYVGTNAIQASVFPIPAGDTRTLEIEFNQLLPVENGLVQYVYPLRTRHISPLPVGQMSLRMDVESNDPIGAIYSPSHRIDIVRNGDNSFVAGFETNNTSEATDFNLYYGLASDEISLNLLSYRESANDDGFFTLLVAPPVEVDESRIIPKDVTIVLDQSGSMYGDKWEQAINATKFVLDNLNSEDRFNLVVFSTGIRVFGNEMQSPSAVDDAKAWLDQLEAIGGTNIDEALQTALDMLDNDRQNVVLFLTDGLPTEGITDVSSILDNLTAYNPDKTRIFTFGVGDDVDTFLLDQISQTYSGASSYVRPDEPIDEEVSALYNKISLPVLANIELNFDGINVYDLQPASLSDLFVGSQLVVVGRYTGSAENATLRLSGEFENETQTFVYENLEFRSNAGGEVLIPRLWATRKIGELLTSIRLNGENQELVDSIVRLSIRYGIITPYTSFLITEDDILSQTGREVAVQEANDAAVDLRGTTTGADAVDAAEETLGLSDAEFAAAPPASTNTPGTASGFGFEADNDDGSGDFIDGNTNRQDFYSGPVQYVGDRTFLYRNGVWIDTLYNPDEMETVEIEFLSDDYFELLDADERVAEFLALGEQVIFVIDDTVYEIIAAE